MYKHFLSALQNTIRTNWNLNALSDYNGLSYTYGELAEKIVKYHIYFKEIGIKKGDKIAICSRNCADWAVVFLAITSYEAVVVPLLYDFLPENIQDLVEHSESKILFTEDQTWNKLDHTKFSHLQYVISISKHLPIYSKGNQLSLEIVNKKSEELYPDGIKAKDITFPIKNFDDLAVINYTSGTTSAPKGVMITYGNISSNIQFAIDHIPNSPGETILSMLPQAHMYGMVFEFIYPVCYGVNVVFLGKIPSPQTLFKAFSDVKPYILITVPLVLEKIFTKKIIPILETPKMKFLLHTPLKRVIYKKINKQIMDTFGGNIRHIVAGGAAFNQVVENLMRKMKLPYTVGYGMTECAPLLAYADHSEFAQGSCGKTIERMEMRVDSSDPENIAGELQVRGANVMLGYYKNEQATNDSFTEDGWLKTGDLGIIDKNHNVFIRGRSKNMILSSNGQNIYPEELEDKLMNYPYIMETLVVSREGKLIALIVPDFERIATEKIEDSQIRKILDENLKEVNKKLPNYCKINSYELRNKEFEKTPKQSIRRFLYK